MALNLCHNAFASFSHTTLIVWPLNILYFIISLFRAVLLYDCWYINNKILKPIVHHFLCCQIIIMSSYLKLAPVLGILSMHTYASSILYFLANTRSMFLIRRQYVYVIKVTPVDPILPVDQCSPSLMQYRQPQCKLCNFLFITTYRDKNFLN